MCEAGASRFRELKTAEEEQIVVYKAISASTKYKNKWATSIFSEWQTTRTVQVAVPDSGGMFKDYDLHKVMSLSARIEVCYGSDHKVNYRK